MDENVYIYIYKMGWRKMIRIKEEWNKNKGEKI